MTNNSRSVLRLTISLAVFLLPVLVPSTFASAQARQTSPLAIETLIHDLKSPDSGRRKEAARLLGDARAQKAVPELIAASSDSDVGVRREIVIALDKMLDMRALPAFIQLSADADKEIRERSIVGMLRLYLPQESGLGAALNRVANFFNPWSDEWADVVAEPGIHVDTEVISALNKRLLDADDGIRVEATRSLGILRGSAAVPALLEALRREQTNALRFEIIRSLRKIGDGSVARELMNYLTYRDSKVRNEAIYTIGRLRYREAVAELMRLFEKESSLPAKLVDKPYQAALLQALALIADPAAKATFEKERQNPEDSLRFHAFEGLARLADTAMVTDISRAWLQEKNARVKTAQTFALFRMGRREFLDELVNCLNASKTSAEARQYLLELNAEELPELYSQTKNNEVKVREGLAEVLGLIGDERAIPVLQGLAQDRRGQIAALATQAMRRLSARFSTR